MQEVPSYSNIVTFVRLSQRSVWQSVVFIHQSIPCCQAFLILFSYSIATRPCKCRRLAFSEEGRSCQCCKLFSSRFSYSNFLQSGTVTLLVHLLPKVEHGEGWIFCVGQGFTDMSFFCTAHWSLDCSQTASPSTSPFPQWRLLLEPFIWSASWVHEQGRSVLC